MITESLMVIGFFFLIYFSLENSIYSFQHKLANYEQGKVSVSVFKNEGMPV